MTLAKEIKFLTAGALAATVLTTGLIVGSVSANQPNMQAALRNLEQARHDLQNAAPDNGSHRGHAIDLVNQAIREVNARIRDDRHR